jgi:hypothetical protein
VSFGPESGTFFAWDHQSFRWSGLPATLNEIIQGHLKPNGWEYGPPVMVAFGPGLIFCIQFKNGFIQCSNRFSESYSSLSARIKQSNANLVGRFRPATAQNVKGACNQIYPSATSYEEQSKEYQSNGGLGDEDQVNKDPSHKERIYDSQIGGDETWKEKNDELESNKELRVIKVIFIRPGITVRC